MHFSTARSRRHRNVQPQVEQVQNQPFFSRKHDNDAQRGHHSPFFQKKEIAVGQKNDKYEQEADAVADKVVNKSAASPQVQQKEISSIQRLATSKEDEKFSTTDARMAHDKEIQEKTIQKMNEPNLEKDKEIQKMEEPNKEEEKGKPIQTKSEGNTGTASPQVSSKIESSAGKGNALPPKTQQEMGTSFGVDFSQVRVHQDSEAIGMNRELQAQAFTHDNDIYFNEGKYDPNNATGKHLLAHELTHVVQQGGGIQKKDDTKNNQKKVEKKVNYPLNFVYYTGGTSGYIGIVKNGVIIYQTSAFSGNPGAFEYEKGVGPIPHGQYRISPHLTRAEISKPQSGIGGAAGIGSGFQRISSNHPVPCNEPDTHYCSVACSDAPVNKCFTPVGVWGTNRVAIEGSVSVATPDKKSVIRDGFYLHGGDSAVNVTSGCIKVLDTTFFEIIHSSFDKSVPLIVDDNSKVLAINYEIEKILKQIFN